MSKTIHCIVSFFEYIILHCYFNPIGSSEMLKSDPVSKLSTSDGLGGGERTGDVDKRREGRG
jgi:hypothetical protein